MIAVHQRSAGRGGPLARGRIWTRPPQASTAHERPAAASAPDRASALQQQRGCARWPASSNGSVLGDALRGVSALPRPRGLGCAATHDRGAVRPQQERTQERSAPPRCGPTRRFGSRAGRYAAAIEHPADCRARPALPSRLRWPACAPCRSARAATPLRGAPGLRSSLAQGRGPRYAPRRASAGYSQVRRPSHLPPSIENCPDAAGHPSHFRPSATDNRCLNLYISTNTERTITENKAPPPSQGGGAGVSEHGGRTPRHHTTAPPPFTRYTLTQREHIDTRCSVCYSLPQSAVLPRHVL